MKIRLLLTFFLFGASTLLESSDKFTMRNIGIALSGSGLAGLSLSALNHTHHIFNFDNDCNEPLLFLGECLFNAADYGENAHVVNLKNNIWQVQYSKIKDVEKKPMANLMEKLEDGQHIIKVAFHYDNMEKKDYKLLQENIKKAKEKNIIVVVDGNYTRNSTNIKKFIKNQKIQEIDSKGLEAQELFKLRKGRIADHSNTKNYPFYGNSCYEYLVFDATKRCFFIKKDIVLYLYTDDRFDEIECILEQCNHDQRNDGKTGCVCTTWTKIRFENFNNKLGQNKPYDLVCLHNKDEVCKSDAYKKIQKKLFESNIRILFKEKEDYKLNLNLLQDIENDVKSDKDQQV